MIIRTTKTINKVEYDYTYSDADMYIKRNDICYTEAIDPLNSNREYEETDIPIDKWKWWYCEILLLKIC